LTLIYIHGFNSSALSFKAGLLRRRMAELRRGRELACPELSHRPSEAIGQLESLVEDRVDGAVALIGSSLGGFYATWLAEKYGVRAVLVNPAVRPYTLLAKFIGPQTNLYTNAHYELTARDIDALRELEVERITPRRYLVMVATGDEVLDYRDALERYRGAEQRVFEGEDHGFSSFGEQIDEALRFCGVAAAGRARPV
jgi:predicted esterase YcpF (UPF0227 family)